jgi:hypothetical protein
LPIQLGIALNADLTEAKERFISSILGRIIQHCGAGSFHREQDQPTHCHLASDSMRNPRGEVQ